MNIKKLSFIVATFISSSALAESSFVIDAGSSGTRLYEYDYQLNISSGDGLPTIQNQIKHDSIAGGIQTIDIRDLETYLSNLFNQTSTTPDHIYSLRQVCVPFLLPREMRQIRLLNIG